MAAPRRGNRAHVAALGCTLVAHDDLPASAQGFSGEATAHPIGKVCNCARPPFHHAQFERAELGVDGFNADVAIDRCNRCGQSWLHYALEDPQETGSGRWWRAALSPEQRAALKAADARGFIEAQYACFAGGSYFDSTGFEQRAPIRVA